MLTPNNAYRCDAEIGTIKAGWHSCGRKAHYKGKAKFGVELHYCEKHKNHFGNPVYASAAPGESLESI